MSAFRHRTWGDADAHGLSSGGDANVLKLIVVTIT